MVQSSAARLLSLSFPVCSDDLHKWLRLERRARLWEGILLGEKWPQLGEERQLFGACVLAWCSAGG